jgi:hypothetical protein
MAGAKVRANGHQTGVPAVPIAAVKLDKVRHMRLDMNALAIMEDVADVNLLSEIAAGGKLQVTAKRFRGIVYALLRHEDPELTEERVGELIHPGNMIEVVEVVRGLVEGATANPKEARG